MSDPIKLPDEYKEKGWAASITDADGNVDLSKVYSKIEGQEHMLGKKVLPGKNATEEEWKEFAENMTKDYTDEEYSSVLDGLETKAEMVAALKKEGLTPAQARKVAELYKAEKEKTTAKKYDQEEFKTAIKENMDEATYNKVKAHLVESGRWDAIENMSNADAIATFLAVADIVKKYGVDDKPGHTAGTPAGGKGNGKGANNQQYVSRIYELVREGKTNAEAKAIADQEFGVEYN
jgi:hypothetical protein